MKDEDFDGFTDITSKLIVIRTDNVNEVGDFEYLQKKQLRHEIIHAFMSESGLQCNWQHIEQFGHDETTVDWFAIQSPKILIVPRIRYFIGGKYWILEKHRSIKEWQKSSKNWMEWQRYVSVFSAWYYC